MGDRFVLIRFDSAETTNRLSAGRKAIANTSLEQKMREELATIVGLVISTMNSGPVTIDEAQSEVLLRAANVVTLARTAVEYDFQGNVIDAHAPEMPTRFAKQLTQIVRGAMAIGMTIDEAMRLAIRCARDSMPPLRLTILEDLAANPRSLTPEVRKRINKPRNTVDRQLQALHMLGVCDCEEVEYDDRGRSRWYYSLVDDVNVNYLHPESVQEMLVDVLSGTEGEEEQDDNEGTDIQVTNISRTLAGEESNGEVKYCECGRALTAPESVKSGKCKPCRDKMMAGYDQ